MGKNRLKAEPGTVFQHGYGTVPLSVMRDRELPAESKAIYAYLCSYAGKGNIAFPGVERMLKELNMGGKRFYKYMDILKERGFVRVKKTRSMTNKFPKNVYILVGKSEREDKERLNELKTMPYAEYLMTDHWARVRRKAFRRARFACQYCGDRERLNVHHLNYQNRGEETAYDLIVLCEGCHERVHNGELVFPERNSFCPKCNEPDYEVIVNDPATGKTLKRHTGEWKERYSSITG